MKDKLFRILNTAYQAAIAYLLVTVGPQLADIDPMNLSATLNVDALKALLAGAAGAALSALSMAWRKRWLS